MANSEINEGAGYIGYKEALALILSNTSPAKTDDLSLYSCAGYVSAEDIDALVDSPTNDVSLTDGFAVKAIDLVNFSPQCPSILNLVGVVFAGARFEGQLCNGQAVKVCSGSPIPVGADAVISVELSEELASVVRFKAGATVGQNICYAGEDVKIGTRVLQKGQMLSPMRLGLIAVAGVNRLKVYAKPKVALIAIGDEIVAPGQNIKEGQVYASNLVKIAAWLSSFNVQYTTATTTDNIEAIRSELLKSLSVTDAIITSGSAWESERDLVVRVLDGLGWKKLFHYVRMGPGKGTSFGIWEDKPVFCLPGGPSSNETAFLELALPGVLHLAGVTGNVLQTTSAKLSKDIVGRNLDWTEFKKAKLANSEKGHPLVTPYSGIKRLQSMINANCLICKPEGVDTLRYDQIVTVQVMIPTFAGFL